MLYRIPAGRQRQSRVRPRLELPELVTQYAVRETECGTGRWQSAYNGHMKFRSSGVDGPEEPIAGPPQSQRSIARVRVCLDDRIESLPITHLVDVVEDALSCPVQSAVKRPLPSASQQPKTCRSTDELSVRMGCQQSGVQPAKPWGFVRRSRIGLPRSARPTEARSRPFRWRGTPPPDGHVLATPAAGGESCRTTAADTPHQCPPGNDERAEAV